MKKIIMLLLIVLSFLLSACGQRELPTVEALPDETELIDILRQEIFVGCIYISATKLEPEEVMMISLQPE